MAQFGNIPEIKAVKKHMAELTERGLVKEWELPYENILTRLSAAIFFLTPVDPDNCDQIWKELAAHNNLQYRLNEEKKISQLTWRVEFKKEPSMQQVSVQHHE